MPSGAGSSATFTTARSNGCWRSRTTCGWQAPAPRTTRTSSSPRCSTRPAARPPGALDELRELAHGIYPAILTEAGLAPALETLADEAPLPVELGHVEPARQPPAVETTAYVAVDEAIEDAARRGASFLAAGVVQEADRLVVTAEDDGDPRSSRLVHLADRIGAHGGSLEVGENTLRADIPVSSRRR